VATQEEVIGERASHLQNEARRLVEEYELDPESVAIALWGVGMGNATDPTGEKTKPRLAPELAEVIEDKTSRNDQILHRLKSIDPSYRIFHRRRDADENKTSPMPSKGGKTNLD